MNYSVQLLVTAAACNSLIGMATQDRTDVDLKRQVLVNKLSTSSVGTIGIDADIAATTSEIASLETIIAGLVEGDIKKSYQSRLTKLVYKLFTLHERKDKKGELDTLTQQYDIGQLENQIVEIDVFLAALNDRKLAL